MAKTTGFVVKTNLKSGSTWCYDFAKRTSDPVKTECGFPTYGAAFEALWNNGNGRVHRVYEQS